MADLGTLREYRNGKFDRTMCWLGYAYKLIGFINTYGPIYDDNYFSLVLNLNNIVEHYLLTGDPKIISGLTTISSKCTSDNKTAEETFKELRSVLYQLPVYSVSEVNQRQARHK